MTTAEKKVHHQSGYAACTAAGKGNRLPAHLPRSLFRLYVALPERPLVHVESVIANKNENYACMQRPSIPIPVLSSLAFSSLDLFHNLSVSLSISLLVSIERLNVNSAKGKARHVPVRQTFTFKRRWFLMLLPDT